MTAATTANSQRLAFIAYDHNARLLTFNLESHRVLSVHTVGEEPDVLALDPVRNRLYVASESSVVAVFKIEHGDIVKRGEGYVGDDAHSISVDPATGLVYLPIKNFHGHPVLQLMAYKARHAR